MTVRSESSAKFSIHEASQHEKSIQVAESKQESEKVDESLSDGGYVDLDNMSPTKIMMTRL